MKDKSNKYAITTTASSFSFFFSIYASCKVALKLVWLSEKSFKFCRSCEKRLLLSSYFGLLLHELWRRHLLWIFIIFHLMCVSCLFFLFLLPLTFHRHVQKKERRYFFCLWKPYTYRRLFVVLFFCHSTRFFFFTFLLNLFFFLTLKTKTKRKKEICPPFQKHIEFPSWNGK